MTANFNRIARAYRWMEYLSFGPMLQHCRLWRIGEGAGATRVLVLGDGDGRFLAELLWQNPRLQAEAVDASPAMLRLLERRVTSVGAVDRLVTRCEDIRSFTPIGPYDLVATHFFLDCLSTEEIGDLAVQIRPCLVSGTAWIVSDFAVPAGWMAVPSRLLVSGLYAAFGILTGLEVRRLPRHVDTLRRAGFCLTERKEWLGGLLFSELWRLEATADAPLVSHSHDLKHNP